MGVWGWWGGGGGCRCCEGGGEGGDGGGDRGMFGEGEGEYMDRIGLDWTGVGGWGNHSFNGSVGGGGRDILDLDGSCVCVSVSVSVC